MADNKRITIKILGVNELKYEIVHTVYHGNFCRFNRF